MIHALDLWLASGVDRALFAAVQFLGIALVALALDRTWLRRVRPRVRLAVWCGVLVPLVVPVRPEVPGWTLPGSTPERGLARTAAGPSPADPDVAERPTDVLALLRGSSPEESGDASVADDARFRTITPAPRTGTATTPRANGEPVNGLEPRTASAAAATPSLVDEASGAPWPWRALAALAWLLGAAVVTYRAVASERRLRAILRRCVPCDERTLRLVDDARRLAELRRPLEAVRCDALASPAVHGLFRVRVLVPEEARRLSDDELLAVLTHEAFHVRRRDLLWLPFLTVVRVAWWFHPLVHVALRRLADALEETRDHDALVALAAAPSAPRSPSPARLAYARVLVRLAEVHAGREPRASTSPRPAGAPGAIPLTRDGRGLTRRIEMIVTTPPSRRVTTFAGVTLAAGLAGLGLVRASSAPEAPSPEAGAQDRRATISVERPSVEPAWRRGLHEALDRRIDAFRARGEPLDVLRALGEKIGVEVRVNEESIYDEGHDELVVDVGDLTGAEALDQAVLRLSGIHWSAARGAVYVGHYEELPRDIDLRFYRIAPILVARGIEEYDVREFVSEFAFLEGPSIDPWDPLEWEGTSIDLWRGLLAVRATDEHHAQIETVLGRLLNAQYEPDALDRPWAARIDAALAKQVDGTGEEVEAGAALAWLAESAGVAILHPGNDPDDDGVLISFRAEGATIGQLLEHVADKLDRHIRLHAGAIVLTEPMELETRLHSIRGLLEHGVEHVDDLVDEVSEFIRGIDAESWDMDPTCMVTRCGDLLVIRQSRDNHLEIALLLDQLERALGGH